MTKNSADKAGGSERGERRGTEGDAGMRWVERRWENVCEDSEMKS